jgi:hypothetical protein
MYFGSKGAENPLDVEALEVQLSLPSVWEMLAEKGQHHAVWFTKGSWLSHSAWRNVVTWLPKW